MRTTINLNDELLARAIHFTGQAGRSALGNAGLQALIERESARQLSRLNGMQPSLKAVPRRRGSINI